MPEVITADFVYYRLRKPDYTEADVDAFACARERTDSQAAAICI